MSLPGFNQPYFETCQKCDRKELKSAEQKCHNFLNMLTSILHYNRVHKVIKEYHKLHIKILKLHAYNTFKFPQFWSLSSGVISKGNHTL